MHTSRALVCHLPLVRSCEGGLFKAPLLGPLHLAYLLPHVARMLIAIGGGEVLSARLH